jgi:hypothetical protein
VSGESKAGLRFRFPATPKRPGLAAEHSPGRKLVRLNRYGYFDVVTVANTLAVPISSPPWKAVTE